MMDTRMKQFRFIIALNKKYFDTGLGVTNYVKYLIAFFGLASADLKYTLILAFVYALFCYFFGMFWIKWGLLEAEQEVSNIYNLFVKEMREKFK